MFDAIIADEILSFERKNRTLFQDGNQVEIDLKQISPKHWHVLHQNKSYSVVILNVDADRSTVELSVNGMRTTVQIRSQLEKLLKEMGLEGAMEAKLDAIKAPMPGLIRQIHVKPGDVVSKGDTIFILEAMKMENVIKSPGDGVVKEVHVTEQSSVEKGELLASFGE